MFAIQFPAIRHSLEFFQHGAVWPASRTGKQRIVGSRVLRTEVLEHSDELLGNRNLPFLPVLGTKSPVGLCGDADPHVLEVDIAPSHEPSFGIAESRHEIELEASLLRRRAS